MLLCSAGDFYGSGDVFNEPKSHFIARAMSNLEYDAVGVGDMELGFGLDALISDMVAYKLPITCANITPRSGRKSVAPDTPGGRAGKKAARRAGTVFPPYLVVKKSGVRFAFVGLLSGDTRVRAAGSDPVEAVTWAIEDPLVWARKVVPVAREHADAVIVLAHMDEGLAEELAREVAGIDAVVIGHQLRSEPFGKPKSAGARTLLLKSTSRGQNLGVLSFDMVDGAIENERNRIHMLDAGYEDDPEMAELVAEFERENRKQQKILYAKQQLQASKNEEDDPAYVGLGACQSCHADAFDVYTQTAHARAYETLTADLMQRDTNCVHCHVTGYEKKGGFGGIRIRGRRVDLVDVQCEACHGPGADHARDGSYAAAAKKSCVGCHTADEDPDFDFERDWPKIEH